MAKQAVRVAMAWRLGSAEQPVRADNRVSPIDWRINTPLKRGFSELVREITGGSSVEG